LQRWNAEISINQSKGTVRSSLQGLFFRLAVAVFLTCSMLITAVAQDKDVEFVGESRAVSTTKPVTGDVSGAPVQGARTGNDFHIIVNGLPTGETVQLELGFAELEFTAVGARAFNLSVNNKPALQSFDVIKEAGGPLKSIVKKFSITPTQGILDFHFTGETGEAFVNFIRIQGEGTTKLITAPVTVVPGHPDPDEQQIPPDQQATFDVETGTIHLDDSVKTWSNGVPIGGIGTGKFEILPNGQFGNFTINNSWDLPVLRPRGTFLAVAAKATSRGGTARLLQVDPTDGDGKEIFAEHSTVEAVDFNGQYPFANWDFKDEKFPLNVTVNSWSPVVPYNLEDSSIPAGIVNVVLENPRNYPVAAAVAFSWEDLNGRGGSLLPGDQYGFTGRATHQDAATSSVTGFQINTDYVQKTRQATFTGNYFIGTPIKGAAVSRKLAWNPRTGSIPWWKQFSSKLRLDRIPTTPASVSADPKAGPTASTLCVSVNLAPKEVRRIPFIAAWYFPEIVTIDPVQGEPSIETLDYASRFGSSAGVASHLALNRVEFREATDEWFDLVSRSSLPKWLLSHSLNSLFPVKTNSVLLKDQRFAMLEAPADMKGMLGSIDLRLASSDYLRSFYPDLEKRELNLYARAQDASGRIPRYVGNIHGALAGFDPNLLGTDWVTPTAAWILQVAAYWRETGDQIFVDSVKPAIGKARDYLVDSIKSGAASAKPNAMSATDKYPSSSDSSLLLVVAGARAAEELLDSTDAATKQLLNQQADSVNFTQTTSTYTAMLAGEQALHAAAIPGFISSSISGEYLKKILSQNYSPKPVPLMESGADSTVAEGVVSYPAVLQSYISPLALSLGLTEIGLEPYIRMFQIAYAAQKNPWKQALRYDVPAGATASIRYHRSSMAAWSIWRATSGVVHDVPNKRLLLSPQTIGAVNLEMEVPVFTPSFWGWLKYHQADSTGTLSIIRVNDALATQTITSLATAITENGTPQNLVTFATPFIIEEGATLKLEGWPGKPGGTVTPEEPKVVPESIPGLELDDLETTSSEASTTKTNEVTTPELEQGEEMPPLPEPDEE